VEAFLGSDLEAGASSEEGEEEFEDARAHALMLRAAGVGEHTRKRKLSKARGSAACRVGVLGSAGASDG